MRKRVHRVLLGLLLLLSVAGLLLLLHRFGLGIPCPFYTVTGLYCPGCGTTRGLLSLMHLDFRGSFHSNPLTFVLLPVIACLCAREIYAYIRYGRSSPGKYDSRAGILLAVAAVAFGIARNLPAFSFLAPTVL